MWDLTCRDHRGRTVGVFRAHPLSQLPSTATGWLAAGVVVVTAAAWISRAMPLRIALVAVAGLAAFLAVWAPLQRQPGWALSRLLKSGKCGHCGYAIAGLPHEADGCTVCPECAAAWRLPGAPSRTGLRMRTIRDDRGQWTTLVGALRPDGSDAGPPLRPPFQRSVSGGWALAMTAAMGGSLLTFIVLAAAGRWTSPWTAASVLVFAASVAWFAGWPRMVGVTAPWFVREMVRRGRCPSCGYSLAGLSREADGCTVCPECGAAWRAGARSAGAEKSPGTGSPGSQSDS